MHLSVFSAMWGPSWYFSTPVGSVLTFFPKKTPSGVPFDVSLRGEVLFEPWYGSEVLLDFDPN